ncbi:MAG: hypothetical protein V3V62_04270 [bacterium]
MAGWTIELDAAGAVVEGRTVKAAGAVKDENGAAVEGYETHAFAVDLLQVRSVMEAEEMTAEEALEALLTKELRALKESSGGAVRVFSAIPASFAGFEGKVVGSEVKDLRGARA